MKIGATISPALLSLLEKSSATIDYVEVNGEDGPETLRAVLARSPALVHDVSNQFWLNYEDPFAGPGLAAVGEMLAEARPPWFSTGIGASAEPQGHTTPYWRGAAEDALQPRQTCLENIVRNGRRLAEWLPVPLLLENYNYHPTRAYEYVCEPETFSRLIEAIGCGVLLDLAHARISAYNLDWTSPEAYLAGLPLERVREIHINHPYLDPVKGMLDRHLPLEETDLALLRWVVERTPALEAVTLESEPRDAAGLTTELDLLRGVFS